MSKLGVHLIRVKPGNKWTLVVTLNVLACTGELCIWTLNIRGGQWYSYRLDIFPLTSFMGRDSSFLVGFLHILQVSTDEDIVYNL